MKLEALENLEILSPNEYLNDSVEPIEEFSRESQEEIKDSTENLESIKSRLETPEVLTDLEMSEGIANYLETVEELKYEKWKNLSLEQRAEVLNRIEQNIAALEHRPPLNVEVQRLKPKTMGYQSASENKIVLNSLIVGSDRPELHREVIDTIIHEGRHAYQHYNVDVKTIHESPSEVQSWRENFYDPKYQYYQSGHQKVPIRMPNGTLQDADYRLYYYQPVEIDARNFASEVMSRLEAKGVVPHQENLNSEKNNALESNSIHESTKSFESGFDLEHPMPNFEQLKNMGFSTTMANKILYNTSHVYSQRELYQCLYESDDPVKAYNEMMSKKAKAQIDKTEEFLRNHGF